jgi:hypothetical protein
MKGRMIIQISLVLLILSNSVSSHAPNVAGVKTVGTNTDEITACLAGFKFTQFVGERLRNLAAGDSCDACTAT